MRILDPMPDSGWSVCRFSVVAVLSCSAMWCRPTSRPSSGGSGGTNAGVDATTWTGRVNTEYGLPISGLLHGFRLSGLEIQGWAITRTADGEQASVPRGRSPQPLTAPEKRYFETTAPELLQRRREHTRQDEAAAQSAGRIEAATEDETAARDSERAALPHRPGRAERRVRGEAALGRVQALVGGAVVGGGGEEAAAEREEHLLDVVDPSPAQVGAARVVPAHRSGGGAPVVRRVDRVGRVAVPGRSLLQPRGRAGGGIRFRSGAVEYRPRACASGSPSASAACAWAGGVSSPATLTREAATPRSVTDLFVTSLLRP